MGLTALVIFLKKLKQAYFVMIIRFAKPRLNVPGILYRSGAPVSDQRKRARRRNGIRA